ncbi:EthD family reductase [Burkholderia cepacia]|uniref:EthD family reductase n=1 Tax=Burkholderia cepacia TaxID=292 RepID=UPI00158D3D0F|nr:EthD family reductase [Burkholderia cepacia]
MATLIVSYAVTEGAKFDREYYLTSHAPLVQSAWGDFGLQSAEVLFPVSDAQPFVCVSILRFGDQGGISLALSSENTADVIEDVKKFTNIKPAIFCAND